MNKKFFSKLKIDLELEVINHLKEKAFKFPYEAALSNKSVIHDDVAVILNFWLDYQK